MDYPQAQSDPDADFYFIHNADIAQRMTPGAKIRDLLSRGMTQEAIAERLGVAQSSVNRWSRDQVDPKGAARDAIDELHNETLQADLTDSTPVKRQGSIPDVVQIIGKAGAGPDGEVEFVEANESLAEVAAPRNATATTVGLEVAGNSMRGIANDGWLIFYDDRRDPVTEEMFGELCVVGLEDGRTLVKYVAPGRGPGLFDLESMNALTMRDVPVRWAAFVTDIVPRRAARQMIRKDPSLDYTETSAN